MSATSVVPPAQPEPAPGGVRLHREPHVPIRTCAGCGERAARGTLRRLALAPDGATLEWRGSGGRGTYLHDAAGCRSRFVAGKKRLPGLRATVGRAAREALVEALPAAG